MHAVGSVEVGRRAWDCVYFPQKTRLYQNNPFCVSSLRFKLVVAGKNKLFLPLLCGEGVADITRYAAVSVNRIAGDSNVLYHCGTREYNMCDDVKCPHLVPL